MKEKDTFDKILRQLEWIRKIIQKRNWDIKQDLIIERPATLVEIEKIERELGQRMPDDLKKLFLFSRRVEFKYQFDEEMPNEFKNIFSGEIYWDLGRLKHHITDFHKWVQASLDASGNDDEAVEITGRLCKNKIPLINVPNGDVIVIGNDPSEIIYFSHEGDKMHGKRLADNLWDFLHFHSSIGFIGSEDWQFEPFYDFETDKMVTTGQKVSRFIDWMNK